jgi:zeta-carotene desaturase
LVSKFWEPVVVSACNVTSDRACAALALKVFQEGLLAGPQAARIGVPRVPLGRLYERLTPAVALAGGTVELGVSVSQIGVGAVRLDDGRELAAPCIVCALPFERAIHVLDEPAQTGRLAQLKGLQRLGHSPILGVHLSFDRPVINLPHAVLVGGATQWLFRKDQAGTRVHAVISAADGWTDLTEEQIVARVMGDLRAYFPAQFLGHGPAPSLVHARAVKERRATFVPAPGVERLRPAVALPESARAGRNEVLLAGCYTNTGWPSTMEGATRSGYEAAGWVLGQDLSVPDLEPAPVMRVLRTVW